MTDSQEIKNKIIKTELVEWKKLDWLQNPNLKEMTKESFERLKNSLKKNDFIMPFNVWQNNGKTWILDGHHRKKAMEEIKGNGYKIPGLLPANFIRCKNRKEAVRLILVYSAIYANVTEDGLYEFLNAEGLDFNDLKMDVELPQIDWKEFEKGWMKDEPEEPPEPQIDKAEELKEKWGVELGQLWELGEHRLICGDCTDRAVVETLGHVDVLFTDPPYGIMVDTGWLSALNVKRGKPANLSDDLLQGDDGSLDLSFLWQYNKRMVWGFPYIYDSEATGWIVWDKQPGIEDRGIVTPIEMAATTMRKGFDMIRVMWGGYYRAAGEDRQPHPTQKPVGVFSPFIEAWTNKDDIVLDPFLGSGTTLIACERINRKCRAIDISPAYCAVSIQRWVDLTGKKPKLIT
jgi:DNA modification methylase